MIVDCVMATPYELEVLMVRDLELYSTVDLRVIVVGDRTFQNQPQSSGVFQFVGWRTPTKVITVELPPEPDTWGWERERILREASLSAAYLYNDRDNKSWYLVADADEIPHPLAVRKASMGRNPATLKTDYREWFMDLRAPNEHQLDRHATMGRPQDYADVGGPAAARIEQPWRDASRTGWHLSNLGTAEFAKAKLDSFAHDVPAQTIEDLEHRRTTGLDILERFQLEPADDLPKCAEQFPHLLASKSG